MPFDLASRKVTPASLVAEGAYCSIAQPVGLSIEKTAIRLARCDLRVHNK